MAICVRDDGSYIWNEGTYDSSTCDIESGPVPLRQYVIMTPSEHEQFLQLVNASENAYICDGIVTDQGSGALTCSTGWDTSLNPAGFDPASLDPVLIAGAVGVGFFALVPVWAAAIGVKYIVSSIK